ncbi:MAG TPA: TIGR02266 family protein, partial [Polyangiales bacterium]
MSEMRKDRRAPASLKVKYKSATVDEFIEQFGTDISRGGIFIKTKKPLDAGALLKFAFQLQDGSAVIHGVGRVTWRRSEQNAKPDAPAGMGIKFIKLGDESRAVVDRIAATHGPKSSRFEHTEGAELAPPMSLAPPPARDSVPPARPSSAPAPLSTSNAPRVAGPAPRTSGAPQSPAAARTGTGPQAGAAVRSSAAPQVGAAERTSTGPQVGAAVRSRAAPQVGAAARTSTGPRAAPVRSSEEPKPAVSGTTSAGLFAAPAGASAPRVAPPAPPETSGPSGANLFGDEPDLAASAPVGRASAPDSGPALPPRPAVASDKPADAAFKLPKGMVGSFFGEEAKTASMPKTTRDTSEFLASAFSAGGAGQDVRAEAHAQAEQARRDQGPADLADELFGDMPSQGDQSAELTPLGNPEDLAGLPRLSEPKVPSLAEVSLAEQIPSLEELTDESSDEVSGVGAGIEGADDDDEEMFGEADLGAASVRPLQPVSSARAPAAAQPSRAGLWVGLLVLLLAVGGGAYYFLVMRPSAAAPASAPQAAAEPPSAAEPEPVPAPAAAPSEPEPAAAQPTAAAEPAAAPPAAAVAEPA